MRCTSGKTNSPRGRGVVGSAWMALTVLLATSGCTSQPPATVAPVILGELDSPYAGQIIQCEEGEAEWILEVFVTIKGTVERWPFEVPLRRATNNDWPSHSSYFCAAGTAGGYSGVLELDPQAGEVVRLHPNLQYSSPQGNGELDEVIETTLGNSGSKVFHEVWTIEWSWRSPNHPAAQG